MEKMTVKRIHDCTVGIVNSADFQKHSINVSPQSLQKDLIVFSQICAKVQIILVSNNTLAMKFSRVAFLFGSLQQASKANGVSSTLEILPIIFFLFLT